MQKDHQIISQVYAAKENIQKADELIRSYIPFIRSEVSKFLSRLCTDQDDEFSIAMIAFHEAIRGYSKNRGPFLSYASMLIRSRLIDFQRKESRHQKNISLEESSSEDELPLGERLADKTDYYEETVNLEATKQEIEELGTLMATFGVSFTDVAENSPKQERTLDACTRAIRYAVENKEILDELLKTKKLPIARLTSGAGVERKTLERHRKYIVVMLLIQTNGYEIIRGHLRHVLKPKGDVSI